jgi:tRNA (cmo5U34)-methyltransferase
MAFARRDLADDAATSASVEAMKARLPILSSDEDEELLLQAGFADAALFYSAFSFRGWVATAFPAPKRGSCTPTPIQRIP